MSQEDLLFRMTAARCVLRPLLSSLPVSIAEADFSYLVRLMALSTGEAVLTKEAWTRTAELDERRKEGAPAVAVAKAV